MGENYGPIEHREEKKPILDSVLLTTGPTTSEVYVDGFSEVSVRVNLSHNSATKITMRCEAAYSEDEIDFFRIQDSFGLSISKVTGNLVYQKIITGSSKWVWLVPSVGKKMRFVFSHIGASSDTVTVSAGVFQ